MDKFVRQENSALTPDELKHLRASKFANLYDEKSKRTVDRVKLENEGVDPDSQEVINTDMTLEQVKEEIRDMKSMENRRDYQKSLIKARENPLVRVKIQEAKK